MESVAFTWLVAVCLPMLLHVTCGENIGPVIVRVDDLDHQIVRVKKDMSEFEERVLNKMDVTKIALRSELTQDLRKNVKEVMAAILQGESIGEMLENQIISEVRNLQKENSEIRKTLKEIRNNNKIYREALLESERHVKELKTCSKYVLETQVLQGKLDTCKEHTTERNDEIRSLELKIKTLNFTLQEQQNDLDMQNCSKSVTELEQNLHLLTEKDKEILELRKTLSILNDSYQQQSQDAQTGQDAISSVESLTSTSESTTEPTKAAQPIEERSRILVAPLWSQVAHQLRQLNIQNNTVETYNYDTYRFVTSIVYVSKLRKLFLCLFNPKKIVSTSLDGNDTRTVIEGVCSYDMTVDEEEDTVFTATCEPQYAISKFSTKGHDYSVIKDLTSHGKLLSAIAVDPQEKKIYAINVHKLFVVSYNGQMLQIFDIGNNAVAMTLDIAGGVVYYSSAMKLMKLHLSLNVTTEVSTFDVIPWNFEFYKDTVYYSSTGALTGHIGSVDVGYSYVASTLQTIKAKGSSTFSICIVP